jgi:biopolymer transport protein ExbD
MTPMVDIVFQLLVFFVLASGGRIAEQHLAATLSAGAVGSPEARQVDPKSAELWIHVKKSVGHQRTILSLNAREYGDCRALHDALIEQTGRAPESLVVLDIANEVPLAEVIEIYDACRAAKCRSINFAATPAEIQSGRQ